MNEQRLSIPWGREEYARAQAIGMAMVAGIGGTLGVACVLVMFDPKTGMPLVNFQALESEDPRVVVEMLRDAADHIEKTFQNE